MQKSPQKELDEFLASKPSWMQKALRLDHSSFTTEENIEWIKRQDEVNLVEIEYRRLLRETPDKWNEYCKRVNKLDAELVELERKYADLPKGLAGAPRSDEVTSDAVALMRRGRNFAQIAEALNKKYSKRPGKKVKKLLSPEAIRKRIERFLAGTKSEE